MTSPEQERARLAFRRWRQRPDYFCREVLGFEPWEDEPGRDSQAEFIRAVPHHKSILVRSGHKTGKSRGMAGIALWAYALFPGVRVVLTAPTWTQVAEVVWREIGILWRAAQRRGIDLGGTLYKTADHGAVGPSDRQIFGRATDKPDNFSGISGPMVIYLVDEGSGVPDPIDEAIEGNRAGGAWKISSGNPTQVSGWFFRGFHEEANLYRTFHLSSERTPTARGVKSIPGLAAPEWIEARRKAWAPFETDPRYAVRVWGDFPGQAATTVVKLALYDLAVRRWTPKPPESEAQMRLEVGLDCARFGDDTNAIASRRGRWMAPIVTRGGMDSVEVAGWARHEILKLRTHAEATGLAKKPRVKVDVIGIGAGVYDHLRRIAARELEVVPVNVAESPQGRDAEEEYSNLRAQLWFNLADWIAQGGMLPPDAELRSESLAPQYSFDVRGRQKVESKDDLKKRVGRSPDRADAACLSVFDAKLWAPKGLHIEGL